MQNRVHIKRDTKYLFGSHSHFVLYCGIYQRIQDTELEFSQIKIIELKQLNARNSHISEKYERKRNTL